MKFLVRLHSYHNWGLLAFRLTIGIIFIVHGAQKWAMWGLEPSAQLTAGTLGVMKLLSIVEPLGGLALILGFFSQPAALGLAIIMVGAIFMKITVFKIGFIGKQATGWEFDLLMFVSNIHLFLSGAGDYSVSRFIKKANK